MRPPHKSTRLTALCTAVYFVSYLSRINLAAVMVALIQSGFADRETAALALTLSAVTYGLGQIVSGWLGDRFRPQNVIFFGFLLTGTVNLWVSFLPNASLLAPLWAVNGFAQACMWPPLISIMNRHLSPEEYSRACVWVYWGSSLGSVFVYAFAPLLIRAGGFRPVFGASGAIALAMALLWKTAYEKNFRGDGKAVRAARTADPNAPAKPFDRNAVSLMLMIMAAIILQGALRDGVTNWMPTFLSESFSLSSSSAIFAGILLPLFQIPCTKLAAWFYRKHLPNEAASSAVIFTLGAAAATLLPLSLHRSVILSALLMALTAGAMHGVNFILISMTPPCFRPYGHISLISGALNCCTYLGSAFSTYGVALFSDSLGWQGTSLLWAALAAAGAALCFSISGHWKRFRAE